MSGVKRLRLAMAGAAGWKVKALGRARVPALRPGGRFTVAYRVTAPSSGPPIAVSLFTGTASYDPPDGRHSTTAKLGETVSTPAGPPLRTIDATTHPADFGASGSQLAISSRGVGVFNPPFGAAPTDSYAAIYERAKARLSSVAVVTVLADRAGGVAGGAGLIERDERTASNKDSRPAVVLFVSGNSTIVMAWNARGGAYVDQHYAVPSVIIRGPVRLRLIRKGSSYSGYYSTDRGKTWEPVATVTVAGAAASGKQDVGVFHASGLQTWSTTARFRDFRVR